MQCIAYFNDYEIKDKLSREQIAELAKQNEELAKQNIDNIKALDKKFADALLAYIPTQIKEQNYGVNITFWLGTTDEYNMIEEKVQNCFYIVTDDQSIEEIKADITTLKYDYIVEQGTTTTTPLSTGYFGDCITWFYRKWKSGLVECWGESNVFKLIAGGCMSVGVPLPFEFLETPKNITYNFYTTDDYTSPTETPHKTYALTGSSNKTWIKPYIRTEGTLNNVTLHINIIGKWGDNV